MKMNKNLLKKSKISLFIAILFLLLPSGLQAEMTKSEINQQISAISFVLQGFSQDLESGRISRASMKTELDRLSTFISNFLISAQNSLAASSFYQDPLPGQVLGAFSEVPLQQPLSLPEAFISMSPGSGVNSITTGRSAGTVLSFKIKPFYSEIEVRRVDVAFNKKMWFYAEEISLVSGGKTLARVVAPDQQIINPSNFFDIGSGNYALRFTDFSEEVGKDRSKTFSIKVKAREFIPEEMDIRVFLNNKSIRAADQSNIQHLVPGSTGGIDGSFSREFRVKRD